MSFANTSDNRQDKDKAGEDLGMYQDVSFDIIVSLLTLLYWSHLTPILLVFFFWRSHLTVDPKSPMTLLSVSSFSSGVTYLLQNWCTSYRHLGRISIWPNSYSSLLSSTWPSTWCCTLSMLYALSCKSRRRYSNLLNHPHIDSFPAKQWQG